jgi:hypothetical protein
VIFNIFRHTEPAVVQIAFQYSVVEPVEEVSGNDPQSYPRYKTCELFKFPEIHHTFQALTSFWTPCLLRIIFFGLSELMLLLTLSSTPESC